MTSIISWDHPVRNSPDIEQQHDGVAQNWSRTISTIQPTLSHCYTEKLCTLQQSLLRLLFGEYEGGNHGQVTFTGLKRKYIKFSQPQVGTIISMWSVYSCPWLSVWKDPILWEEQRGRRAAAEHDGKQNQVHATLREMACLKHSGSMFPPGRSALSRLTRTFWWHSLMLTGYLALSSS